MKLYLIILFLCISTAVMSQNDTVFLIGPNGSLAAGEKTILRKEIRQRNHRRAVIRTWKTDTDPEVILFTERIKINRDDDIHTIQIKGNNFTEKITRTFAELPDGTYKFTDRQAGHIKRTGTAMLKIPLLFHGEVTEYHSNENKKSVSVYEHNELISNKNWDADGNEYIHNVFYSVDQQPLFVRGTHNLNKHVLDLFRESGYDLSQVEGRIVVGFVVMEDGSIDGLRIEKGLGRELNDLAIQAFSTLPGIWESAKLDDKEVRYYQLFPINFIYKQFDFDYLELSGSMIYWQIN